MFGASTIGSIAESSFYRLLHTHRHPLCGPHIEGHRDSALAGKDHMGSFRGGGGHQKEG